MRRIKTVLLCVLLAALLGLCIFSAFVPPDTWKYHVGLPKITKRGEGEMRIHFLDVGQGDCTLIELPDGKVALIDGGDDRESTETTVMRYLNALKIDVIDYLIVSHADADHCGSLDRVVEYKTILNAYLPTAKPGTAGDEYANFYAQLLEEDCTKQYSARYTELGNSESENNYAFTILYPYSVGVNGDGESSVDSDDNINSSVLWLDYRGVSALFTGDAPLEVEEMLMRDDSLGLFDFCGVELSGTEILKVAHHGSADSTSLEFLNYLQPQTAVISCGKNNIYGHPAKGVCENLEKIRATSYRTDEQGTVIVTVTSAGEYTVSCAK